jgi:hypothetical protein
MSLTIETIKSTVIPIAKKYSVKKVDLFGSYADGSATEKSDVDFLVKFNTDVPSIFKVMGFREELERDLNNPVDVVTLPLSNPGRLNVEKAVNIYERTQ